MHRTLKEGKICREKDFKVEYHHFLTFVYLIQNTSFGEAFYLSLKKIVYKNGTI